MISLLLFLFFFFNFGNDIKKKKPMSSENVDVYGFIIRLIFQDAYTYYTYNTV